MTITHFRDLDVWQVGMELVRHVYGLTARFPREERYGLAAQMQRAAVSIPSNIAEGNARHSRREYARFVSIASGSIAELQTQLLLARDLNLLKEEAIGPALELAERVSQMLYRLQRSLDPDMSGSRVPGPGSRPKGPRSRISEEPEEYL